MKRILSTILLCVTSLCAVAQEDVTLFFLNDGTFKGFYDEEIDSIAYSHFDLDSVWHSDAVVQEVWLADSVVRIPIEKIDSICHKIPEPEYRPETIILDDRYLPYITSVNGLTISFSSGLPENLRPRVGDILVYEGSSDQFPVGFAGKVIAEGERVICEEADFQEVYNRLVFFGKYVLVSNKNETGDSAKTSYSLRRLRSSKKSKTKGDEDYGIDNWRMGDGDIPDISLGTVQKAVKFELKKIHTSVKLDSKITPVVSIEYAYDGYWLNPLLFYKCTFTNSYDLKIKADFSLFEWQPKDDLTFWGENEPDWYEMYPAMDNSDENDDENCQSIYIADQEVPIPDFPLLKVGFKLGFFFEPKIEGSLSAGLTMKGTAERTYIYNLDKNHWLSLSDDWKDYLLPWRSSTMKYFKIGEGKIYKGPTTCENDWFFEGSAKASAWLGLIAAANVSVGISKNAEAKEEVKLRIGPYIEGEIKANFKEANEDWSLYSMLKDSKIKNGIKLGIDLKFSAKLKSKDKEWFGATWDQFDWSPKELLWESNMFLLPDFTAPKYSIRGNSLTCTSELTRKTFSNIIGFALYDETGKEKRIYRGSIFKNYKADNPYLLTLTFDNLDFANHRYTIVPTTRPFDLNALQMDLPDEYRTTVLCPDSRHPHLIDLGLPSGTKWLCSNLYADDPKDAGGYYQWGKPYMVHSYTDITYRAPNFTMANYQSSEYDAATVNLGQEYCTPTMSQFNELHDNCSMDYKYSPWGNVLGMFLKGKNGNNLYLPFSGYKSSVKVNNNSEGWFLSSDAVDSNNNLMRKAVVLKDNDVIWHSNDAMAYGHSVRPVSAGSDGLVIEPQQLDYEVYVGQKVGQSVTVTNNGSAPVNVTVAQTIAPFHVDEASLGTFTVKPKELHSFLVYFSPTEEKEYTSVLTLSYEAGNACVVSKVPLKGKGINAGTITPGTAIDLGLPSGTLWASCNVGATKPEDYGNYYAWGETEEKDYYYWDNYMCEDAECGTTKDPIYTWNGNKLYADIAGSKFDVATSKWGPSWHMPSSTQMDELLNECIWTWCDGDKTKYNGTDVKGYIISSKVNNNKIFLPAAGNYYKDELLYKDESCLYWSSSQFDGDPFEGEANYTNSNSAMGMDYNNKATYTDLRYYGQTIRPVMDMNAQQPSVQTETFTVNGVSFKMIAVEGGTFQMGSTEGSSDEQPVHQVTLSSFCIGETEVTQELWQAVMGNNPSYHQGSNLPVEQVSRNDCKVFISKLNKLTGKIFRLPTEAEWEYAARGGNNSKGYKYAGSNTINTIAWYENNSGNMTHPVAGKHANELGLYDMSGNVWEMVQDYYDSNYYSISPTNNPCNTTPSNLLTMRGGGVSNNSYMCRATFRAEQVLLNDPQTPVDSGWDIGLRLVLSDGGTSQPMAYLTCPDDHHPHLIDLGLPSGTKWACCNIGATNPCEGGLYFAWGETEGYTDNISDGRLFNSFSYKCTNPNYGPGNVTILLPEDDAAHVNWGGSWRMPTYEDFDELLNNTYQEWTTQNDVVGRRLTSKIKGNSIFLPSAGERYNNELNFKGVIGNYWTSSIYSDSSKDAWLYFSDVGRSYLCNLYRYTGRTIRPVVPSGSTSVSEGDEL